MNNEVKVSVVVPVYNGEKHLEKSLVSLIAQTFFHCMEIILVDDGSTDGSGAIIDSYAQKYSQIKALHIPNGGVSNARNLGAAQASGAYISFVDADDWVDPLCYEAMYARTEDGKNDIVAAGLFIDDDHKILLSIQVSPEDAVVSAKEAAKSFLRGDLDVHVVDKLFRREIAQNVKFNPGIRIGEDRLYLFDCLLRAQKVSLMQTCYYHYYQNTDSVMQQSFSQKHFDDVFVGKHIIELTAGTYPELVPYAECMNINGLCRILGDICMAPGAKLDYAQQYKQLLRQVRGFSIRKSIRFSSQKHWISLMIAKVSPMLYGRLRSNRQLKYKKA